MIYWVSFLALKEVMDIGGLAETRLYSFCSDEESPSISSAVHLKKALETARDIPPVVPNKIEFQDKLFYIYTSGKYAEIGEYIYFIGNTSTILAISFLYDMISYKNRFSFNDSIYTCVLHICIWTKNCFALMRSFSFEYLLIWTS